MQVGLSHPQPTLRFGVQSLRIPDTLISIEPFLLIARTSRIVTAVI
jgi:hypothetical protein